LTPEQVAGWLDRARWRAAPCTPRARLLERVEAVRAALAASPEPRKAGRRKALFALALDGPAPDHLLKVQRHGDASLARRLGRGAAARELALAHACAARGVATPLPLAAGTVRRAGLLEATLLLVPIVAGAVDLARLWDAGRAPARQRRAVAAALGVAIRALHDAGVDQDDLAPNNFLWRDAPEPRVLAIDFERVRIVRRVAPARRALALARLDRHLAGASAGDRMRLLRSYAGDEARAWWAAVRAAHGPLAAHDFAHLLRTGTRASRRFEPVAAPGVTGWARRDAPLAEALAALAGATAAQLWVTPLGALRSPARAWAAALVLAQRAAAPPPVALLCRQDGCHLVVERADGARRMPAAGEEARGALVGLLDRLLAFGFEPSLLSAEAVVLAPRVGGGRRAELLDPRGLRPGRVTAGAGAARAWACRLLPSQGPSTPRRDGRAAPGSLRP
jgi:hypothetical protein